MLLCSLTALLCITVLQPTVAFPSNHMLLIWAGNCVHMMHPLYYLQIVEKTHTHKPIATPYPYSTHARYNIENSFFPQRKTLTNFASAHPLSGLHISPSPIMPSAR